MSEDETLSGDEDPFAVENLSDQILEESIAYLQFLRDFHSARGRFLSTFNGVMADVGRIVAAYLEIKTPDEATRDVFFSRLMGRYTDSAKIEIIRDIGKAVGADEAVTKPLANELNRLLELRNTVAHSAVGPNDETLEAAHAEGRFNDWINDLHHTSFHRTGYRARRADIEELRHAIGQCHQVGLKILHFSVAVIYYRRPDSLPGGRTVAENYEDFVATSKLTYVDTDKLLAERIAEMERRKTL